MGLSLAGCGDRAEAPAPKLMVFEEAALFEFDKADLAPEGQEQIATYREQARADLSNAEKVRITVYTDNTGTPEYNSELSMQRAKNRRVEVEVFGTGK